MAHPRNIQGPGAGSMTIDRLHDVLDAYGASAERWPAAERGPILALLNSSAEARALRDGAYALDRVLDRLDPPPPSEALVAALSGMTPAAPQLQTSRPASRVAACARPTAIAASVLMGAFIGFGAGNVGNFGMPPAAERQTVQTAPAEEVTDPAQAVTTLHGPPVAPGIASPAPASSGLGTAPLLAGSDSPLDESEGSVPLI